MQVESPGIAAFMMSPTRPLARPLQSPTVRIRAHGGWSPPDLIGIVQHRELLLSLTDRDVRVRYKQTALGVAWVVLQPLLTALIFAFVFGVVAGLATNDRPYLLFAFAGLMAWNTFATTINRVGYSLVGNAHMISKIYFPRLILPLSSVCSTLVDFGVSLALMLLMLVHYRVWPGWGVLLLPVWLTILLMMGLGIGLVAASLMVKYRDVGHLIPVALQLGMYISPVAWSTSFVPEKYQWVYQVNPFFGLLGAFRWSLLGETVPSSFALAYSGLFALVCMVVGLLVFQVQERDFADVI